MQRLLENPSDELESAATKTMSIFLSLIQGNAVPSRITPEAGRDAVRECFEGTLGQQGAGLMSALQDFEQLVLPRSLHIASPMYMGLVNSSPLPGAALMDCLVSAIDNNAGASHQGPAADACELEVVRSLSASLGLDSRTTGMFVPGGTYANLHGLLLARTACAEKHQVGCDSMTLYYSEACHFSIARAGKIIGFPPSNLKAVPTRGRGSIDTEALEAMVEKDRRSGLVPCAVVGNLGSTGTGALDPVDKIVDICEEQGLWCHVDACIGGPVLMLEEFARYRQALARADSLSVDLHKWFFLPLTASLALTRHPRVEAECFQLEASYIPQGTPEPYQRGVPTSRRATGLTVWLTMRAYGWGFIEAAVRRNIELTRLLEKKLTGAGLQVLPDGELSVCCARLEDDSVSPDFHEGVAENIRQSGLAWFGTVHHDGHVWWRFNILNLHVDETHVEEMIGLLLQEINRLSPNSRSATGP
ncbi:MAG: hypothetical protein KDE20_11755 [Caldilineaceae bacterium]|nr:hypothetical protein [Caldilineaceae bacterium]